MAGFFLFLERKRIKIVLKELIMIKMMKKMNVFNVCIGIEIILCFGFLLILPGQINIPFYMILTSKQTTGSSLNIFALPVLMMLPNIVEWEFNRYNMAFGGRLSRMILIANLVLLALTIFWMIALFLVN